LRKLRDGDTMEAKDFTAKATKALKIAMEIQKS